MDCPICMDAIDVNKNYTTTECGHCFHSSCLMKSVAHNGFGCPYCRTAMAEEPDDDSQEEEFQDEEEAMFDDYALRGFRFFWNIVNDEEIDEDDDADEEQEDEWAYDAEEPENENIPDPQYVADKLRSQGVTYEQLVNLLLYRDHDEYDADDEDANDALDRLDGQIFGKIRVIVSNYDPAEARAAVPVQPKVETIDVEAQPKNVTRRNRLTDEL